MPLVVGHALLGAGVVAAFGDRDVNNERDWRRLLLTGGGLAVLPDFDLFLTWILGLGIKWHGGLTHSIIVALAIGFLAARYTGGRTMHRTLVLAGAMLSHGLLDALAKKTYGGTQLLWPFHQSRLKLGLFDYFAFYPDSRLDPIWKLVLRALEISIYELLIFGSAFVLIVATRRKLRAHRSEAETGSKTAALSATEGKEIEIGGETE